MAQLTQTEFQQAIALLANDMGLQRLRDRFVRLNGLVTRRKVASPQALADQLYLLSAGLRRQVPATYAFHAIWGEQVSGKLGEEGEKNIEKIAETVNACLGDDESILPEKAADLDSALAEYARRRRVDRTASATITHWLPQVFATRFAPVALARSLGLTALDLVPPLRNELAHLLMFGVR